MFNFIIYYCIPSFIFTIICAEFQNIVLPNCMSFRCVKIYFFCNTMLWKLHSLIGLNLAPVFRLVRSKIKAVSEDFSLSLFFFQKAIAQCNFLDDTNLEKLHAALSSKDAQFFALFAPSIPLDEKCYRYKEKLAHEAGYDSFLAGFDYYLF